MIGVCWGTSSFRAFWLAADGHVLGRRSAPRGTLHIAGNRFAEAPQKEVGPWLAEGETRVPLAGMIGGRQGWVEASCLGLQPPLPRREDRCCGLARRIGLSRGRDEFGTVRVQAVRPIGGQFDRLGQWAARQQQEIGVTLLLHPASCGRSTSRSTTINAVARGQPDSKASCATTQAGLVAARIGQQQPCRDESIDQPQRLRGLRDLPGVRSS